MKSINRIDLIIFFSFLTLCFFYRNIYVLDIFDYVREIVVTLIISYCLAHLVIGTTFNYNNIKLAKFDFLVIVYFLFLILSLLKQTLYDEDFNAILFFVRFISPLIIYFYIRQRSYLQNYMDAYFSTFFWIISVITLSLIFTEFFTQYLFKIDLFQWSSSPDSYRGMPIYYKILQIVQPYTELDSLVTRPRGWSGLPQATGSFMVVYLLYYTFSVKQFNTKNILFVLILLSSIYLSGSRTAIIYLFSFIFFWLSYKYTFQNFKSYYIYFLILLFIFIIYFVQNILIFTDISNTLYFIIVFSISNTFKFFLTMEPDLYLKDFNPISNIELIFEASKSGIIDSFFGLREHTYYGDIFLFNNFMNIGLLSSFLFSYILINSCIKCRTDLKYLFIVISYFFLSFHYDLTALFPANLLLFLVIALIINKSEMKLPNRTSAINN